MKSHKIAYIMTALDSARGALCSPKPLSWLGMG